VKKNKIDSTNFHFQSDREVLVLLRIVFETNVGTGALSNGALGNVDLWICCDDDLGTVVIPLSSITVVLVLREEAKLPPELGLWRIISDQAANRCVHGKVAPVHLIVRRRTVLHDDTILGNGVVQ